MFGKRDRRVRWDEVGIAGGKQLLVAVDSLSRPMKESLADLRETGIPDFDGSRWKYELCIFVMFWWWYVANSPKFQQGGATKPFLDAYHRGCLQSMINAGLVGRNEGDVRKWEDDLGERFTAYKKAFETVDSKERPVLFTGTAGWVFAQYLFPSEEPNPKLAVLVQKAGSIMFRTLADMIKSWESQYGQL